METTIWVLNMGYLKSILVNHHIFHEPWPLNGGPTTSGVSASGRGSKVDMLFGGFDRDNIFIIHVENPIKSADYRICFGII